MVFRSIIESKTPPHTESLKFTTGMASSTLKSNQPLHNFPLQDLKWSMNHTNNHRFRKLASDSSHKSPHRETVPSNSNPIGNSVEKSEKKLVISDCYADNSDKKSKIFIRIRTKNCKSSDYAANSGDQNQNSVVEDAEETITKTWNLRPRRSAIKSPTAIGRAQKIAVAVPEESQVQESSRPELTRSRVINDSKITEKKEKEKEKEKPKKLNFSIPLTKEEIEDDIYALTGSKPARRPKKRAKHIQKQLDCVFPGMWLSSITPDMYRVHDPNIKG